MEVDGLRAHLRRSLPEYMVPGAIVPLERLPLNANGKVDRKALPAPEFTAYSAYEPPRGETEEKLAAIWAEVLGVERVGRNDNFFELGGHSLLSARLVARLHAAMQSELTIRDVFQYPTLAAMAARIAEALRDSPVVQALSEIDSLIDSMETV
jgi:acyl carrier protein